MGLVVLLSVAATATLDAQAVSASRSPGTTVSGIVTDSIAHAPLSNATVQLVSPDPSTFARTAISDSLGHFLISDVPLGRYMLGFFHPLLDSLGVEAPLRELNVDSYTPVIADLAVPSPARIRRAICGNPATADGGALIVGVVRNAQSSKPDSGVIVTGEWLEYAINRGGMSRRIGRLAATTGENGWFAICNVPSTGTVALTASRGDDSTGVIEIEIPADGFVRRDMYLGDITTELVNSGSAVSEGKTTPVERRVHTGNGHLAGTIVTVADGVPVANAQVNIIDGPTTHTNERGEFSFVNAPAGTQMIEIRLLGYYPSRRYVNIVGDAPRVKIALSTLKAVLDTVKIIASRLPKGPDDGGFAKRIRMGQGHFITPQDVVKSSPIVTTDLFRRIPGVRMELDNMGQPTLKMRGAFEEWCSPAIFIDGANVSFMDAADIDHWVHPGELAGIEVYTEATAPGEFRVGLGGCGSVVIWTK
jgi:hypothetical protein